MNRILLFIIAAATLVSCSKTTENIIWEKSFGQGRALFVQAANDSVIVSCGESDGKQYLLYLDADKNTRLEYKPEIPGLLNTAWTGEKYFIAAGSSGGKMYLAKIDITGTVVWDSAFLNSFRVDRTSLCYLGSGEFLAIGSADPDSAGTETYGLSFIWFDNSGSISKRNNLPFTSFIAVNAAVTDAEGNIYMALTKQGTGGNTKAAVTKYTFYLTKQWEKEISNNPSFGAASLGIILDDNNNPIISGRTELQVSTGKEDNTFLARYIFAIPKDSLKRNYLEFANSGTSIIRDGTGNYLLLNSRCNIVNFIGEDIEVTGIIRTYSSCDSKTTDIFGYSIALDPSGNILIAGTKGGGYHIALKSSGALSPV